MEKPEGIDGEYYLPKLKGRRYNNHQTMAVKIRRTQEMKTLQAQVPEALYDRVNALVKEGWFRDRGEVLGEALRRFIESHQGSLAEKFVREDVEWGLRGDD
jgi:Arc/MetJ-type ribon-helix-helix transcriptional regulator